MCSLSNSVSVGKLAKLPALKFIDTMSHTLMFDMFLFFPLNHLMCFTYLLKVALIIHIISSLLVGCWIAPFFSTLKCRTFVRWSLLGGFNVALNLRSSVEKKQGRKRCLPLKGQRRRRRRRHCCYLVLLKMDVIFFCFFTMFNFSTI